MENQEKNAEEKIIITRDETLYHEQLAKGCVVLGCIIGAIIYFLSGNLDIALIVAICSSILFTILIMIGQKKEKKPLKTDNLSKNKEKSKRYITQLAKNSRSNTKISRWNKILFCLIFGLTFMGVTLGFYELVKMNKKLEQRRAERLRLENPQKQEQQEHKKDK